MVTKADDVRFQVGNFTGRFDTLCRTVRVSTGKFVQAVLVREQVDVRQYVAEDDCPVSFSPQRDVSGGVAGGFDHLETPDGVPCFDRLHDWMTTASHESFEQSVRSILWHL